MDQINKIVRLRTKLKYDINDRNQIHSLPFFFFFCGEIRSLPKNKCSQLLIS